MFFLSFYFYLILFFLFCFILYLSYLLKLRLRRSGIDLAAAVRHFLEITNIQALLTLLVLPEITTGPDVVAVRAALAETDVLLSRQSEGDELVLHLCLLLLRRRGQRRRRRRRSRRRLSLLGLLDYLLGSRS